MKRFSIPLLAFTLLLSLACFTSLRAKNVILMIGDGMGTAWITATRIQTNWKRAPHRQRLHMDTLPYTAFVKSYCSDGVVTGSAAAGTSIATGVKTNTGAISQNHKAFPNKKMNPAHNVPSIAELAKQQGMAIGIVSTARITHATPAVFYAHTNNRDDEKDIAKQLVQSKFDLFLGGGKKLFSEALLENSGYKIVTDRKTLLKPSTRRSSKPVLGLFADSHMALVADRRRGKASREPSLIEMTYFALKFLKTRSKDFFLMVEGARIDHTAHDNNIPYTIQEIAEFDKAVGKVLNFVQSDRKLAKNTLVLVTSDHETGGLAINGYISHNKSLIGAKAEMPYKGKKLDFPVLAQSTGPGSALTKDTVSSASHTAVDVPAYGWGYGAEQVRGTIENTHLFTIMKNVVMAGPKAK